MHPDIRANDYCEKCNKNSLSIVSYTTSGNIIFLLAECRECKHQKTIKRSLHNGKENVACAPYAT